MVKLRKELDDGLVVAWVYLLHFDDGVHYIGATSGGVADRLRRHRAGRGSRWVYRRIKVGINFELGAVQGFSSIRQAFENERQFKKNRRLIYKDCVVCNSAKNNRDTNRF